MQKMYCEVQNGGQVWKKYTPVQLGEKLQINMGLLSQIGQEMFPTFYTICGLNVALKMEE